MNNNTTSNTYNEESWSASPAVYQLPEGHKTSHQTSLDLHFLSDTLRGLVQLIVRSILDPGSPNFLPQTVNWIIHNNQAELVDLKINV